MKKILSMLLVVAMCCCLFTGFSAFACAEMGEPVDTIEGSLELGNAVPNFSVTLPDGSVFTLGEALETHDAVLINIWGTWCHNCVDEMPAMQEAYESYSDRVGLICLSMFDDDEAIVAFQQEQGLNLPLAYDSVGLSDILAYEGFPTTIVVDRFGNYAFYHCGAMNEVSEFTCLFDYFISEDYTESEIVTEIPAPPYEGTYPTDEELTAALSADGSLTFTGESDWPFVMTENGVVNSNALVTNTTAAFSTTATVEAGDLLAFDFVTDLETMWQSLSIEVDGELVAMLGYSGEGTFTYEFPESDEVSIRFSYEEGLSERSTDHAGTVALSNIRIASGDEAAAILAAKPETVHALTGEEYGLEFLTEGAKQIELIYPEGFEALEEELGGFTMYIVPADVASVRILLGDAFNAENIFLAAMKNCHEFFYGPMMENDGEGYLADFTLSSVQTDGLSYNNVQYTPNVYGGFGEAMFIFRDEANVNSFISDVLGAADSGLTWMYADGTMPASTEAAVSTDRYTITIVDENGDPVIGCMVNICDETNCAPQFLTDTNTYSFNGLNDVAYPYAIHLVMIPAGYSFDTTQEFILNASGDNLVITVPHA